MADAGLKGKSRMFDVHWLSRKGIGREQEA